MLSARNQFKGTVKSIRRGSVMAQVIVKVGDLEFVSAITLDSVDRLKLKEGDPVTVVVKATEVMLATD